MFRLIAIIFTVYVVAVRAAVLSCDLDDLRHSELTDAFYPTPVGFTQRRVTEMLLELDVKFNETRWKTLTVVYQVRKAQSMETSTEYEQIVLNKELGASERVDALFFKNYFNREIRVSWDPTVRFLWAENGTYRARVWGWSAYVESDDPFHKPPFETALNCVPKE